MPPVAIARRIAAGIAALAIAVVLIGQPMAAYASSGWRDDATCCCPVQQHCKCPHGNGGNHAPVARTCGEAGHVVLPIETLIVTPATMPARVAPAPVLVAASASPAPKLAPVIEIETPPF
jgi:hypothetical protein